MHQDVGLAHRTSCHCHAPQPACSSQLHRKLSSDIGYSSTFLTPIKALPHCLIYFLPVLTLTLTSSALSLFQRERNFIHDLLLCYWDHDTWQNRFREERPALASEGLRVSWRDAVVEQLRSWLQRASVCHGGMVWQSRSGHGSSRDLW